MENLFSHDSADEENSWFELSSKESTELAAIVMRLMNFQFTEKKKAKQ